MAIIAFDVSKDELVGALVNKRAQVKEEIILPNNRKCIVEYLQAARDKYPNLTIASEATAEYHRALAEEAVKLAITFKLINPILTKQFTRATIRKKKTDATDALIIAKLVLQGEGTVITAASLDPLKSVNRTAHKIVRLYGMLNAMHQRIQRVFPDDFETARAMEDPLTALGKAVIDIRKKISGEIDRKLVVLLTSIIGVGPTIALTLITEIGDVSRFPSGKSLVAYAGLDPKVKQSGASLRINTTLTKRGSPYLRRSLYIAAYIARRHDPELKAYFEKKVKEGKRYKEAVSATARKLLYRVYAVWKRGTPYVKRYPQVNT